MSRVVVIGAGGVGTVAVKKMAMNADVFTDIMLASRTKSKCDKIAGDIKNIKIRTAQVDAENVDELLNLFESFRPELVVHLALPYQNLPIMDACLAYGVSYLDTAIVEMIDDPLCDYSLQWAYKDRFEKAGLTAILGCGFDPGVTNVYTAYAAKHYFDEIHYLDIVDCNAGNHHKAFATNFNPEINIREITLNGKYFEDGKWIEIDPLSIHKPINYPNVGTYESYLMFHEELESLTINFPSIKRARVWMTFGKEYLTHLRVMQNIGVTSIIPVMYKGVEVIPIQFLSALLPDPSTLGKNYTGETSIGCHISGIKDGKERSYYVYNNCSHQEAYKETGSQGVSYTAGVPAMIGAKLFFDGIWKRPGVWNVEEFEPDRFMKELNEQGLPWHEIFDGDIKL